MAQVNLWALCGLSLWRLLIAGCAFLGFWEYASLNVGNVAYLTQQAAFLAGVVYLALLVYPFLVRGTRHEPESGWARGATAVLLTLVAGTYLTMMAGTYHDLGGLLSHLVTPLLVLLDWTLVGSNQHRARWWHPVSWLAFPLAYLAFYLSYGEVLYGFLNPGSPYFVNMVLQFLLGVLLVGYLLYGVAKLKGMISQALLGAPSPELRAAR